MKSESYEELAEDVIAAKGPIEDKTPQAKDTALFSADMF